MKRRLRGCLAVRAIAVVLLCHGSLRAQQVISIPQNRWHFTPAEADASLKQVLPVLEEVAGRKLKRVPPLKLVGRDEVIKIWEKQHSKNDFSREESFMTIGWYNGTDKVIYLLPANLDTGRFGLVWGEKGRLALLKIAICHELVHALQDQEVDLAAFWSRARTKEERMALKAFVEGHATSVAERVSKRLGLEPSLLLFGMVLTDDAAPEVNLDRTQKALRQVGKFQFELNYLHGSMFIDQIYDDGGMERVWTLFHAPPTDTGMILYPSLYSPTPRRVRDYGKIFDGAEKALGNVKNPMIVTQTGPWVLQHFEDEVGRLSADNKAKIDVRVATCVAAVSAGEGDLEYWSLCFFEANDIDSARIVEDIFREYRRPWSQSGDNITASTLSISGKPIDKDSGEPRLWLAAQRKGKYFLTFKGWFKTIGPEPIQAFFDTVWSRLPPR